MVRRAETLIRVIPVEVILSFSFFKLSIHLWRFIQYSSFCNLVDNSIGSKVKLFMILDHFPLKVQCIIFLQIRIFATLFFDITATKEYFRTQYFPSIVFWFKIQQINALMGKRRNFFYLCNYIFTHVTTGWAELLLWKLGPTANSKRWCAPTSKEDP